MFKLTWHGKEPYENGDMTFQPGESKLFESREDIPAELLLNPVFSVEEVPAEEVPPAEVEDGGTERARGTIPRFTAMPEPDDGGSDEGDDG